MKKTIHFILLATLSSCQWILTHPKEDVEIVDLVEEVAQEAYRDCTDTKN